MDWFKSVQKQAQDAAEKLMQSEAASKALAMAQQAGQQALALAEQASAVAKEAAKEAITEANKGIHMLQRQTKQEGGDEAAQYGITRELVEFASGLTYTTFSEYPMDTLDLPSEPGAQVLTPWQARHAVLVLKQVPQLQDLRFVLCPRKMEEYLFWSIYFTLCRRYLAEAERRASSGGGAAPGTSGAPPAPAAAGNAPATPPATPAKGHAAAAAAAAATGLAVTGGAAAAAAGVAAGRASSAGGGSVPPDELSGPQTPQPQPVQQQQQQQQQQQPADAAASAAAGGGAGEPEAAGAEEEAEDEEDLDDLLQDALQVDDGEGGDEELGSDLDAYLEDLEAELDDEES